VTALWCGHLAAMLTQSGYYFFYFLPALSQLRRLLASKGILLFFFYFGCGFINDAVSTLGYIASNNKINHEVHYKSERIRKEAAVT
jgi:hypothetical protein